MFQYSFSTVGLKLDDSRCTPPTINKCIIHYKGLYILNIRCNLIFGQIIVPSVKLMLMVVFTVSFFALFRLYKRLNVLSLILVAPITVMQLVILIPMTLVISSLYGTSKKFTGNMAQCIREIDDTARNKKILRLGLRSCNFIRCKVGDMYYMEAKAKLTTLHKVVNGLKYLLVNVKS